VLVVPVEREVLLEQLVHKVLQVILVRMA